jgi:hypothetical protein
MLQYTLDADEEAIFVDKATQELILVVLRDFAKDYYDIIQSWSVNLLKDSIDRRSQAVLGVSIGTWHEMLQMGALGLIQVPASSMQHMGSES